MHGWKHAILDILDPPNPLLPHACQLRGGLCHDVLHRLLRLLHHGQQAVHQPLQRLQDVVNRLRTVGRWEQVPHGHQQVEAAHNSTPRGERVDGADNGVHEGDLGAQVWYGCEQWVEKHCRRVGCKQFGWGGSHQRGDGRQRGGGWGTGGQDGGVGAGPRCREVGVDGGLQRLQWRCVMA